MMEELMYQYWLLSLQTITNSHKCRLIEYFGSSFEVFMASEENLREASILNDEEILGLQKSREKDIFNECKKFCDNGFSFVTLENDEYPKSLLSISGKPYGLFYIGSLPKCERDCVAIVGARMCTSYGQKVAFELAKLLSESGYTVVSGMAKGIDSFSHEGALEGCGGTVAVLGCGVNVVYPKENGRLYERIVEKGCVISEYPLDTSPLARQFPSRNRIVSGLCKRVVVVEAKEKSGSLITADMAMDQGKDVYVVPGRLTDSLSAGCNSLISQGAQIITGLASFVANVYREDGKAGVQVKVDKTKGFFLDKQELLVYSCLDFYPKSLSFIEFETGLQVTELMSVIMNLVQKGLIREIFKNQYAYA